MGTAATCDKSITLMPSRAIVFILLSSSLRNPLFSRIVSNNTADFFSLQFDMNYLSDGQSIGQEKDTVKKKDGLRAPEKSVSESEILSWHYRLWFTETCLLCFLFKKKYDIPYT
jgi:hypothetical protein